MIDPGAAAIIAAAVALLVGLGGALVNRRTALDAQRASERAKSLVRVLHIVESNGQAIQDRIFNLTQARSGDGGQRDRVTGEWNDPYAPHPREARDISGVELAEAEALLAAYGSGPLDAAYSDWQAALAGIEDAYLVSEMRYAEEAISAIPEHFATHTAAEQKARRELGRRVRSVLRRGRL